MPTFPKPDDIPKFIRRSVSSAFQGVTSRGQADPARTIPDAYAAEDPLAEVPTQVTNRAQNQRKQKRKKNPEPTTQHLAEIQEGHVRRDVFDATNMPLEGQPAVERYLIPDEQSKAEVPPTDDPPRISFRIRYPSRAATSTRARGKLSVAG